MTILFDVDGTHYKPDYFNGEAKVIIDRITNYVEGRMSVFKDEIEKLKEAFILVILADETGKPSVRFYNFPNELKDKLLYSITEEDYKKINVDLYYLGRSQ